MKPFLKIIAFSFLFLFLAYGAQVAFAAIIASIRVPPTETLTVGDCAGTDIGGDTFGQKICDYGNGGTADATYVDIAAISAWVGCGNGVAGDLWLGIYDDTDDATLAILDTDEPISCNGLNAGTTAGITNLEQITFSTTTPFTIPNGHGWFLVLLGEDDMKGQIGQTGGGDYSSILYDEVPPNPTAELYFPSVSVASTSLPDFTKWRVSLSDVEEGGNIFVYYARATSSLGTASGYSDFAPVTDSDGYNDVPKTRPLWHPPLTVPVTWYAQPLWVSSDQLDQVAGDIQTFTVNPATPPQSVPGIFGQNPNEWFSPPQLVINPLANSSSTSVDCSGFSGFNPFNSSSSLSGAAFACYMKSALFDVGNFLFRPSSFSSGFLDSGVTSFKESFPFSVFFTVQETLSGLSSSSTLSQASSTVNLAYPIGGSTINLQIGSSTLRTYLGETVTNLYFTFARALLWLLFVAGVWGHMTHFFNLKASDDN